MRENRRNRDISLVVLVEIFDGLNIRDQCAQRLRAGNERMRQQLRSVGTLVGTDAEAAVDEVDEVRRQLVPPPYFRLAVLRNQVNRLNRAFRRCGR